VDVVTNLIGENQRLHKEMIVDHNESNWNIKTETFIRETIFRWRYSKKSWNEIREAANREREKKCPQSISGKEEEVKEVWYTKQVIACHCGPCVKQMTKEKQF
jgi:hypothetical protein